MLSKKEQKFILAVKERKGGNIVPGKQLGESQYREAEFAEQKKDFFSHQFCVLKSQIGIFQRGKFVEEQ